MIKFKALLAEVTQQEPYKMALVSTGEVVDSGTLRYVQRKAKKWPGRHFVVYDTKLQIGDKADPAKALNVRKLGR